EFLYARGFLRWEEQTSGVGAFPVIHVPIWRFVAQLALARWETRQVLRWLPEGIDRQLDDGLTKTTLRAAAGYCFLKKKYRGDLGTRSLRSIMLDWVDLQGVDAANMDLAGADFNHSDLRGADLS